MFVTRRVMLIAVALGGGAIVAPSHAEAAPKYEFFDVGGVKIRYVVEGQGEPVLLIHGLHASAALNWYMPGIAGALSKSRRVIAFDLPGHGGSEKAGKEDAYGKQMVADAIALLDHLKVEKAHVVGYSLGGMVALKLIAEHPERVQSGVLGGMGWLREGSRLQKFWEQIPTREGSRTPSVCLQSIGKLAVSEADLKSIKAPMLVLVGDLDPVRRMYVAPLKSVRSDWQVVEIPEAGHVSCIMQPAFKSELLQWLDAHRSK
jgi:pimeloyl-ACP methyl ester carboxylesterase